MSGVRRALSVERLGTIAEVSLLGPGKGNAMGPEFFAELPVVFRALDEDDAVRAIVLRGSGENFCYGLNVAAMMPTLGPILAGPQMADGRERLLRLIGELQASIQAVASCRKPVIAAIDGWCVGGGLDLAAACDIRVCSAQAGFSLREVKLAIVADLGALQRLPAIIGAGHTRELAYTGRDIDAQRALRIGLVNDVYPDAPALYAAARALAREIAENSPLTVRGIKQVLTGPEERSTADGLRYVATWNAAFLQSADLVQAIGALLERKKR